MEFPRIIGEQAIKKLTNQQVADYLGISKTAYEQKKRSGRFLPDQCSKLCELYGLSFEELFSVQEN